MKFKSSISILVVSIFAIFSLWENFSNSNILSDTESINFDSTTTNVRKSIGASGGFGIVPKVPSKPVFKTQSTEFMGDCELYGFSIASCWVPIKTLDSKKTFTKKIISDTDSRFETEYESVLLQNTNCLSNYACAYRASLDPIQNREWGFMGIGSSGADWYVSYQQTICSLGDNNDLANFAPRCQLETSTETIGFSASFDSTGNATAGISASVSYPVSELKVSCKSSPAGSYYETDYSIDGGSDYSYGNPVFFGLFSFKAVDNSELPSISLCSMATYSDNDSFWSHTKPVTINYTWFF